MARNNRWRFFLSLITTTVFLFPELTLGQNECKEGGAGGYTKIDDPRRSVESIFKHGQSAICDRAFAWGWYRFDSYTGVKMPEQKVDQMRCGTVHPIWMRGTHPTVKDGTVNRTACINFYDMLNGCLSSLNIRVRNCDGFFVYYLGPTHSCSLAYCAGYKKPCPYGKTGNPDTACVDITPKLFDNKNLKAPTITVPEASSVTLLCTVELLNGVEQLDDVEYQIEWFADGKSLKVITKKCHQKNKVPCPTPEKEVRSTLPGNSYKAGKWITCQVKARFKDYDWSTPKDTDMPFFAGIQVFPSALSLDINSCKENVGNRIEINSTIPVLRDPTTKQYLKVGFDLPNGLDLPPDQCTDHFLTEDVTSIVVDIMPDCKALKNNVHETKVIVITFLGGGQFWIENSSLRTVWVNVFEDHVEQCYSFTDPHYHGMAKIGITRRFDFMGHGDFTLYKNEDKKFEVQTRQWSCNYKGVTCNCGAVLRDHNDVIEFNCCNKDLMFQNTHPTPLQVKLRSSKCLRPGIYIGKKSDGGNDKYTVIFPTGVKVDIVRNYWGIDVTILTNREIGRESGTCLYEERKDPNMSIDDYGRLQRVDPGKSLFDVLPKETGDEKAAYSSVCSCKKDKCSKGDTNPLFFHVPSFLRDGKTPYNLCDRFKRKRDVHYSDELTDEDYDLFKSPLPSETQERFKRALPAPVISKQNATHYCTDKIKNTKLGKLCADIGVDVQGYVDSCSLDVSLTGDYTFAIGIVSMLTSECGYVAAINESSYKNKSGNGEPGANSIDNGIADFLCPNDCAFNGDCVNGSCVCNKDYTAEDCSISIYQRPSLSRLQGDGLCDKRVRPCKKVTVMGMGWLNSTNITCHVVEFKVVNSSWTPNKTERSFPGIMVDLLLVDCYLPDSPVKQGHFDRAVEGTAAAGLTLSVSNDGIHKSDRNLTFISYDSACMACNVSFGCYLKDESCYINQYCFAPNEVHPDDFCYQCLPNLSKNTWTKRQVNHPPNITSPIAYYALYQENLELTFDVVDLEGMPVTISLTDGNLKEAVMKDNVFYWNVTTTKTTTFYLKATDACHASSNYNFTVSLVSCPCQNNGSCSPLKPGGSGYYSCNCPPGFKGATCETNINDCLSYPCSQGRCVDGVNNYTCICDPGYVGRNCDQDFNDCASSPCVHGNCTDLVNGYTCKCVPGYTGSRCDEDIDECLSSPCFYGTCLDQINSYNCQCEAGYTGRDCDIDIDECQSSPCIHGTCSDLVNGFSCICQAGFSGSQCEVNINECLPVSCGNGTCVDLVNNYTCVCNVGFTGRHCKIAITHCSQDSCYPGVPCSKNGYSITCGPCPSGYQGDGKNCKDINDCANRTCHNGGSCVDGINSYSCNCRAGYSGNHCETNIDECVNHTCSNGGSCVDGVNNYSCNCQPGFTGYRCQIDINDCANRTCHNGGSCVDGINSYSCNCRAGYSGNHCETNIDECVNHTCSNSGSCVDGVNNYSCNCQPGFTGDRCQIDIYDCANRTCHNGGSCVDGVNSYSCNCLTGFTGDHCETNIDDCANQPCKNSATCKDGVNSYSCVCQTGFTGEDCENDVDDCFSNDCASDATCVDGINQYTCICPEGFTGKHCESVSNTVATEVAGSSTKASSSTKEDTLTAEPTTETSTEDRKTDLTFEIRVYKEWDENLRDKTSGTFKNFSSLIKKELFKAYSGVPGLKEVKIISMRPGSTVVDFQLIFETKVTSTEALAPLKKVTADGKLGSLKVDPSSLKLRIVDKPEDKHEKEKRINLALIVGVSVGAVVLLAVVTICVVHCKRSVSNGDHGRVSDVMPPEGGYSKAENYELKQGTPSQRDFCFEEKGQFNEGMD